jgi:hypothetical protein
MWAATRLFEKAVANSGGGYFTSASLNKGLYAMNGETLGGLTGSLIYSEGKASLVIAASSSGSAAGSSSPTTV